MIFVSLLLANFASKATAQIATDLTHLGSPAGRQYAKVVPGGVTILPNGRVVTPVGTRTYTGENLFNVVVSPDESITVGMSDGQIHVFGPGWHNIIKPKNWSPAAAFSPDGHSLYVSEGDEGEIAEYDTQTWVRKPGDIAVNPGSDKDAYINDIAISPDGKFLYAVDVTNEQFDILDLKSKTVLSRVKAGREPYALSYDAKTNRVFVANIGLFDYSVVPPLPGGLAGITRPAFAIPSKEAEEGTQFEGRFIPGIGKTGTPDAQSVWSYDVSDPSQPKVVNQAISGLLIHAPAERGKAVGGSAPNALVVQDGKLYVSNANSDTISIFNASNLKLIGSIKLAPTPLVAHLRGVIPTGLALSKDGGRLYVCESGLESVAVIDTHQGKVLGLIPTGYYPVQARLTHHDSTLVVANQFGLGYGPQGYLTPPHQPDERGGQGGVPGLIEHIELASLPRLSSLTAKVLNNNGLNGPLSRQIHFPPQIKHVVFITKENHTFDGIFGTVPNADGEPRYSEFGDQGWINEKDHADHLPIMPNHVDLAKRFSISDNFYMEPGFSGDGHRWLVGVYASIWTSRLYYAGWNFGTGKAKGRYVAFGSNGSQIPEDYLENGSMWENLGRGNISFRNYGEGFEFAGVDEGDPHSRSGAVEPINFPVPKILFDNTCWEFPIFNTNIPDIARVDWFKDDIKKNYRDKGKPLPQFLNIALCNDHGTDPMPKQGYPYVCSFMADNDLALGRVVEYLSHTPEWKSMAIFVTEDDPGGDNDHVDRSRSYVLAIGPYCKHRYVSHDHSSIMSIIRSIYDIFGLGPNNLFDALATPLDDMFTDKPDFTPYTAINSDPRVFKPEATFDPEDPTFKKRRGMPGVSMDDPKFIKFMEARAQGQK